MITVRPARQDEEALLAELGMAAWRKGIKPLVDAETIRRIEADNPFLPFLRNLGAKVLVAEVDGQPAGIGASEHSDNRISDVWVSPAFEGRGVGSALIKTLVREIQERGFCDVIIHVAAANERAYRLYRHLGFEEVWRRTEFDAVLGIALEKIELRKVF